MNTRWIRLAMLLPLSGLMLLAPPAGAVSPLDLSGTVHGTILVRPGPVDAGSGSALTGSGTTSLGATTVTGHFKAPGFIRGAHCSADLTLSTAKGRVALDLTPAAGAGACPTAYVWKLTSASGPYAGRSGSGKVTFTQGNGAFSATFLAAPVVVPPTLPHTGGVPLWLGGAMLVVGFGCVAASRKGQIEGR